MKLNIKLLKGEGILPLFQKKELLFHPSREWSIGLFVSSFCLVVGLFFVALDFYNQFYVAADDVPLDLHTMEYRAKDVHIFAEKYNAKEATFIELRKNRMATPEVVAPSDTTSVEGIVATTTEMVNTETLADDVLEQ